MREVAGTFFFSCLIQLTSRAGSELPGRHFHEKPERCSSWRFHKFSTLCSLKVRDLEYFCSIVPNPLMKVIFVRSEILRAYCTMVRDFS